jgi:hypothetical protein
LRPIASFPQQRGRSTNQRIEHELQITGLFRIANHERLSGDGLIEHGQAFDRFRRTGDDGGQAPLRSQSGGAGDGRADVVNANRRHRLRDTPGRVRRRRADLDEGPRGGQRLFEAARLEDDVEQGRVVTDRGHDDVGAVDCVGNGGYAANSSAGGPLATLCAAGQRGEGKAFGSQPLADRKSHLAETDPADLRSLGRPSRVHGFAPRRRLAAEAGSRL